MYRRLRLLFNSIPTNKPSPLLYHRHFSSAVPPPLNTHNKSNNSHSNHRKHPPSSRLGAWVALGLTVIGGVGYWYITQELQDLSSKIDDANKAKDQLTIVFVLGGPGAGKGTQCAKIVKEYNFIHLSAGDLLREERNKPDSKDGQLINTYIKEGRIIPMEITIQLLKTAIANATPKTRFLIDGFPRKIDQAVKFEQSVSPAKFVLYFSCPEDEMERRLLSRGKTSGRIDDNLDSIRKRFVTFLETSLPVVQKYRDLGKVYEVSCLDTPDNVYKNVKAIFSQHGL